MQEELAKDFVPVVHSALWAAYGDALGFISEGTDAQGLKRRLGGQPLSTVKWKRKLGRTGPEMTLPAGCYSDDTQLRLATSRAIRADGSFNVDLFSKIEIPLFLAYSLGAGIGTTNSARRLLAGTRWYDMVRRPNAAKYVDGGGNGAAMRVQPHIWVAGRRSEDWRVAVVENVLTTHGHPTALIGALFHAEALRATALSGGPLTTAEAVGLAHAVRGAIGIIDRHPKLGPPWISDWERESGRSFKAEYGTASEELLKALTSLDAALEGIEPEASYHQLLEKLGALTSSERGSGTKTAVAAYAATLLFSGRPPAEMMRAIAEELGSDTDTIGTMAGALVGLYVHEEPPAVLDRTYIVNEAKRLAGIGLGNHHAGEFRYRRDGDISVPKDGRVLCEREGVTFVAGLGRADPTREPARKGTNGELYRWYNLEIGQSMLFHVPPGRAENAPDVRSVRRVSAERSLFGDDQPEQEVARPRTGRPPQPAEPARRRTVELGDPRDAATTLLREGIDDPARLGRFFLARARHEGNEAWVGAVFYELARLYREGLRNDTANRHIANRPPEQPRLAHPALNLQLTASRAKDGTAVEGIIGNYGRNAATDIAVRLSGNGSAPDITYTALQVQETNEVAEYTTRLIDDATTVIVTFRAPDGTQLRQDGRFERAAGHEMTFLLKGLGVARPVTV